MIRSRALGVYVCVFRRCDRETEATNSRRWGALFRFPSDLTIVNSTGACRLDLLVVLRGRPRSPQHPWDGPMTTPGRASSEVGREVVGRPRTWASGYTREGTSHLQSPRLTHLKLGRPWVRRSEKVVSK